MMLKQENSKIKVGVIGAAGYTASELLRILVNHPYVELAFLLSKSQTGKSVFEVHQDLFELSHITFDSDLKEVDMLFLCGGHGSSKKFLDENKDHPCLLGKPKIVDLSQDFRLHGDHSFVYGLSEFMHESIAKADYIANPGCFATCLQLALAPLAKHQKLSGDIHITALTGSTGAGQSPSATTHFSWRQNNVSAYKAFSHQHELEINQTLKGLQDNWGGKLCWVPIRGDFTRGIFATIHLKFADSLERAREIFKAEYERQPFAHLLEPGADLHLKQVVNSNHFAVQLDKHGEYLHLTACIDNLLKGASGQAVQNMNLIFGLPIQAGLALKASAF